MSRNSRNGESAKNRISEFSPNSPFSSKLPFPRAPLPSHLSWKLYFGEFLPYSSNWPLSSKSLLWTAPLCHIIWLVHITMANFCHFQSFRQICQFRQNRQSQMGPLIIFNFTCPKGFGEVSPCSPFSSWTRLSNFSYHRRLDQLIQLYIRLSYTGLLKTATVLFVFYPKCEPLLKPRASAKSFSQKLTHFLGNVLHLALFRNKTWVHWSLQEWPISFI